SHIWSSALASAKDLAIFAGALSLFSNILMLAGPLYMLQVYDRVLSSGSRETLVALTLLVFCLFAAMAAIDFVRSALLARAGDAFENELNALAFERSMDSASRGDPAAASVLKNLRTVRQFLSSPPFAAIFDTPWSPVYLIIIFMMHWALGVVSLVGLGLLIMIAVINEQSSRKMNAVAQANLAHADAIAMSAQRNADAADAMGMRGALMARWRRLCGAASKNALLSNDWIGGLTAVSKASRLFLQSAILGVGALLAIDGAVTPGVMIAASIIMGRALAPFEAIIGQWRSFIVAGLAFRHVSTFLSTAQDKPHRVALPRPVGAVSVNRLVCAPGGANPPVLKGISFELAPGESLGVVGASAAGKTTLARALVGVENAVGGEVRLDGADIAHWDKDALGAHIGYLPQEVELFSGTAAEIFARFCEDANSEDVI
ncbi:MAG: ATP-binding cassette domain-containing protein, partial [Pseudomonadota bacterium]